MGLVAMLTHSNNTFFAFLGRNILTLLLCSSMVNKRRYRSAIDFALRQRFGCAVPKKLKKISAKAVRYISTAINFKEVLKCYQLEKSPRKKC